ncbi:hypothetical protein B0O99DRAFT_593705 [Bisporella sp. PMI_857]|nr:hypothetical protein B0O99DRAFT_593705 [Bisporella sp. PMI_857]
MAGGIPSGAVGASVGVLLYSAICFFMCFLVVCLLWSYGERWTYITMLASFAATSTFASIIQQVHYATSWVAIKEAQYKKALKSVEIPGLALGGASETTDVVLFNIQFYCYNVMALCTFFWAVGLFCGAWGVKGPRLFGGLVDNAGPASKIFAIVWPGLIIGVSSIQAVLKNIALLFVLTNITLMFCMSIGSILLVLILYKYMKTRRLVMGYAKRSAWWASDSETLQSQDVEGTAQSGATSQIRRSIYDRALLTRFTIGFLILAMFEAAIIGFSVSQLRGNTALISAGRPNFATGSAISDILFFIPGVTASLITYLVFGTSKSFKQYLELVVGLCGLRRKLQNRRQALPGGGRDLEFDRLASLPNNHAQEVANRGKEIESRVRHFVSEVAPGRDSGPSMPSAIQSYDDGNLHPALDAPSTTASDIVPAEYSKTHDDSLAVNQSSWGNTTVGKSEVPSTIASIGIAQIVHYKLLPEDRELHSTRDPRRFQPSLTPKKGPITFIEDSSD